MPAKGIRGGMCVENELCTKTRGTDGKYFKFKQSTLVPTTGIQVGGTLRMNYVQRQGERMENILSPNRVPWCWLRGYGAIGALRTM